MPDSEVCEPRPQNHIAVMHDQDRHYTQCRWQWNHSKLQWQGKVWFLHHCSDTHMKISTHTGYSHGKHMEATHISSKRAHAHTEHPVAVTLSRWMMRDHDTERRWRRNSVTAGEFFITSRVLSALVWSSLLLLLCHYHHHNPVDSFLPKHLPLWTSRYSL